MNSITNTRGADEQTPSRSEYFSWINNTNEGSTQEQTLANLRFFAYLRETFGMRLDIYAWDAGNLDGAGGQYGDPDSDKLRAQYPEGYAPIVASAAKQGTRMGIWMGADGYGDDEQSEKKRRELLIKLCKDYRFALFKCDAVCSPLRENMQTAFAQTMQDCRKYCPDLLVLNHRNELGTGEKYATTFLWEGTETYVDVHAYNPVTAPHNRAYMFFRGHTPDFQRLTEDHGVCLSSSLDYFADDLIYQAFNRCLILAPEIYGNPWLLRDNELPVLARIFNLHRRFRGILTTAQGLGENAGCNAVSRGNDVRRFISTGNNSWENREISFDLNASVGLSPCGSVSVIRRFPTEEYLGSFPYGTKFTATLFPFRAALFELCADTEPVFYLKNCEYKVLHEDETGSPDLVNIVYAQGEKPVLSNRTDYGAMQTDVRQRPPKKLGSLIPAPVPDTAEQMYETVCFFADNDSLEARSLKRSGSSEIPQVRAAREAFFAQESYACRGLDTSIPFDENADTFFDTNSKMYYNHQGRVGYRVGSGCLRVDFGENTYADCVEIEYFSADTISPLFAPQNILCAEVSSDLCSWTKIMPQKEEDLGAQTVRHVEFYVDNISPAHGRRMRVRFQPQCEFRFFRLPAPPDYIFSIVRRHGKNKLPAPNAHLTNLFAPYTEKTVRFSARKKFRLKNLPPMPYLSAAFEGKTGNESAYCLAFLDGKPLIFPDRAPAYPANAYEYPVQPVSGNYTFFLPLQTDWEGKEIEIVALFCESAVPVDIYLCDRADERNGIILKV